MKKITALLLAFIISLTALYGCTSDQSVSNISTSSGYVESTPTETTTPTVTVTKPETSNVTPEEPTEPTEPEEKLSINASNIKQYKIVYPEKVSNLLSTEVMYLRADIIDVVGRISMLAANEKPHSLPETAFEIVVGQTNRPATESILSKLKDGEFAIVYEGGRIYIIGTDDDATIEGIKYFKENYIFESSNSIEYTNKLAFINEKEFPINELTIEGVDISEYTVVIPSDADLFTKYAAENLSDFVLANVGTSVSVTTDSTAETKYEILIGDTSRSPSSVNVDIKDGQYVLYKSGTKIVCLGNSYMVGGGVSEIIGNIPTDKTNANVDVSGISGIAVATDFKFKEAKNAILMIGDGMGFNTVKMAKQGAAGVKGIGEFIAESLPYQGSAITSSLSSGPTDSAASATALSSGYKTKNGYLGMNGSAISKQNIRELAASKGAKTSVVTTDVITGATPGGFLVHHTSRNDTSIIQSQINELIDSGKIEFCKGNVGDSLTVETAKALRKISAGGSNFFMMIEEAHIDKRSHVNDYSGCITMVKRYNDVIAYVVEFVICHPDTALVITADHECGAIMQSLNGSFVYTSKNHSAENVPVYALGYGMDVFNGKTVDNTYISKTLAKIFGSNNFGK